METETYKRAKEILEKFDPETKKKVEDEMMRKNQPTPVQSPVVAANQGLYLHLYHKKFQLEID